MGNMLICLRYPRDFFKHSWPVAQEDKVADRFQNYFDQVRYLISRAATGEKPAVEVYNDVIS